MTHRAVVYRGEPAQRAAIHAVRTYVWDAAQELDGLGWQALTAEAELLREVSYGGLFHGRNGRLEPDQLAARQRLLQSGHD